jgi:glycosyltransferase involved in cell wall biosynthesis
VTASADIGVTLLEDSCLNHRLALPNKLFEYLAARVPILGADLPEIRTVLERLEAGKVTSATSPQVLASVLQGMIDNPENREVWKRNTRRMDETFSGSRASERFEAAYASLMPIQH